MLGFFFCVCCVLFCVVYLVCWTVEWLDVSWTSLSINTKYCVLERTNKILSATGKMVMNKLENLVGCFTLHVTGYDLLSGTWGVHVIYTCLQSCCLAFSSLSILTWVVTFSKFLHLISHHLWQDKAIMALEMLGVAGLWSMVSSPSSSMKNEAGDVRRRHRLVN